MSTPSWLHDIDTSARLLPFGTIQYKVKRHRNMTTSVDAITHSSLKYDGDNERAFADLSQLMNNLIDNGFTGKLQFEQTYKNGQVVTISIKNTKTVNYRDTQ
jgi:hypothetical protein